MKNLDMSPLSKMPASIRLKYSVHYSLHTVKAVLSGPSKIGKTRVLKTHGSFMKVESIAKCSLGAFCNTFDLH